MGSERGDNSFRGYRIRTLPNVREYEFEISLLNTERWGVVHLGRRRGAVGSVLDG
jgi:hypothetical protein